MALKKTYSKDKKTCTVTFSVSKEAAHGAEHVTIAGDFNNWSSTDTPLTKDKSGTFSTKIKLDRLPSLIPITLWLSAKLN